MNDIELTDQEIVEKLIAKDRKVTDWFLYNKCRPLFCSIAKYVFNYPVEIDEIISELYLYLLENDGERLRKFQFRCSLFSWLKIVATRLLIEKRDKMIDDTSKEPLYDKGELEKETYNHLDTVSASIDVETILSSMENQRYAYVIKMLIIEEVEPQFLAKSMGITTANLYNIKKRALSALAKVIVKDKYNYDK